MNNVFAHWRRLPLPLRLGLGIFGIFVLIWVSHSLGGASIPLAGMLWGLAVIGVLHSSDRLLWIDRYPAASRLLNSYAPRFALSTYSPGHQVQSSSKGQAPAAVPAVAIPDVSRFSGLDLVWESINRLIQSRSVVNNTIQPATITFLLGPRGTGKSSVSLALARELSLKNIVKTNRIVRISEEELPGLGYSFGPTAEAVKEAESRFAAALDGVLLIDDIDRLASPSGGDPGTGLFIGPALLTLARRAPGRLFIVATGSERSLTVLDPRKRWLGQFNVQSIAFAHLNAAALTEIFMHLVTSQGLHLTPEADRALVIKIKEFQAVPREGPDAFDNAHAVRRLVDAVLYNRGLRIRNDPNESASQTGTITDKDIRDANPMV
jgi:hypothetical protein